MVAWAGPGWGAPHTCDDELDADHDDAVNNTVRKARHIVAATRARRVELCAPPHQQYADAAGSAARDNQDVEEGAPEQRPAGDVQRREFRRR